MKYLNNQLITYLGNKRKIVNKIEKVVIEIKKDYKYFTSGDLFSGSGVVARLLKQYSDVVIANDLEYYSYVINKCYLTNLEDLNIKELHKEYTNLILNINSDKKPSWITKEYAPENSNDIKEGERVFYTRYNAEYLDTALYFINKLEEPYKTLFLAPLLSEASIIFL